MLLDSEPLEIYGMIALPTRLRPLPWLARAKACLSLLLLSTNSMEACLRWAAALAPGPRWASLSSRQRAWALCLL